MAAFLQSLTGGCLFAAGVQLVSFLLPAQPTVATVILRQLPAS